MSSPLLMMALAMFLFLGGIAAVVIYLLDRAKKKKKKASAAPVESMRVDPPDQAQPVAFERSPTKRVIEGTTCLPKQLYLALNYGKPEAERIPASQGMVDALHKFLDNSKDQPPIGGVGAFSLVRKPGTAAIQEFNTRVMAAVRPDDMDRVVVVVESSSVPTYKVYAFIDRGVDWNGPTANFCDTGSTTPCIRNDVWVSATREGTTRYAEESRALQIIPEEGWCYP